MKRIYRKIRNIIRKPIVDKRIESGRYMPVIGGVNAYHDLRKGGVMVKGYYDKPFSYKSELIDLTKPFEYINHVEFKE